MGTDRVQSLQRHTSPFMDADQSTIKDTFLNDMRIWLEGSYPHISFRLNPLVTKVTIERSGMPGGPFVTILADTSPPQDFKYRDDLVVTQESKFAYFRVKIELEDGYTAWYGWDKEWDRVKTYKSPDDVYGITWGPQGSSTVDSPAIVRELRQRYQMYITQVTGTRCLVYRPAWTNGSCKKCTDTRTGSRISSMGLVCRDCFGTGFDGGYYAPMLTMRIPDGQQMQRQMSPTFVHDKQEGTRCWLPYWPRVEPGDILRDLGTSRMWEVASMYEGGLYGHDVITVADLTQLPSTHPLSKVPPPDGFRETSAAPRKQYARATNMESFTESLNNGGMSKASTQPPEVPILDQWENLLGDD